MIDLYGYPCNLQYPLTVMAAAWRGAHGPEFCDPLLDSKAVCSSCGIEASDDTKIFTALIALRRDGHWAGLAMLFHCIDCPPETLLAKLSAEAAYPDTTDEWKFSQGTLGPRDENPR